MTRGLFHRSAAVLAVSLPTSVLAAEWPTMEREEIARSIVGNTLVGSFEGSPYADYGVR